MAQHIAEQPVLASSTSQVYLQDLRGDELSGNRGLLQCPSPKAFLLEIRVNGLKLCKQAL